jgi:hypothetical protein
VERDIGLEVDGPSRWLAISAAGAESAAVGALADAGWELVAIQPAELASYAATLGRFSGIVLDDVAVHDLAPSAWSAIDNAVTRLGRSLLALGGAQSFGAGGYRHSRLESLLPVTAEARDPRAVSAVLFVVDTSGSMGRSLTDLDPMGYAQRAVLETARSLGDEDEVGLIAFDIEARELLPLAVQENAAAALASVFPELGPAGGTRLRPALHAAQRALSASTLLRRLVVLVTDGYLDVEDLASSLAALRAQGAELLVLAVGRDADTLALRELAGAQNVHRVEHLAELPKLMRTEVEKRRRPAHEGVTPVRVVEPLRGVDPRTEWPQLSGFMLTRAKPSARVYLETASGYPVLAAQHAGAGRVAALPAGLGAWAADWTGAPEWPVRGAALEAWLADRGAAAELHVLLDEGDSGVEISVDAFDGTGEWNEAARPTAVVVDSAGVATSALLVPTLPGRYAAHIDLDAAGPYRVSIADGDRRANRVYVPTAGERDARASSSAFAGWIASGSLLPAPERAEDLRFSAGRQATLLRVAVPIALLAAFLALLAYPHRAALAAAVNPICRRAAATAASRVAASRRSRS